MPFGFRLKQRTEPGWLAIHLHADRIDIAHVVRVRDRAPQLKTCESFRKQGDVVEALGRLRRTMNLQRYRCTTAVDPDAYQLLQVEAPKVPAEEMRAALRWRVKDLLEFPLDQAVIDMLDIPMEGAPASRTRQMFAVAARAEAVRKKVSLFQQAGIPLEVIDIPEMIQRNIAALFESPNRGLAMLAFSERGGLLTFTHAGELFAARRIDIDWHVLTQSDNERRTEAFDRIVLELQRSFDNFDRQFSYVSLQRLLVCAFPSAADLIDILKRNLYLPVEEAHLNTVMESDTRIRLAAPAEQMQYLGVIGLALRDPA